MAVMDGKTGKILKYKQLINLPDPKVVADWGLSSANKFGHLFQGVWECTKLPSNTSLCIHKHEVLTDRFKDVTYGKFECSV